jgi:divalent metal cation (Fe/Co/Zn/Cd) transporter
VVQAPLIRRGLLLEYLTLGWNVVGVVIVVVAAYMARSVALRLIGAAFFALALYILAQITVTLLTQTHPAPSIGGIAWLAATFIAMLFLAYGKRVTGKQLGNVVLMTEGHVTLIDAYLAGAVLIGLVLNALFGWWWADPLASLVIVYYGIREGMHAWRSEEKQKDA